MATMRIALFDLGNTSFDIPGIGRCHISCVKSWVSLRRRVVT
jgi:hypothetical protein